MDGTLGKWGRYLLPLLAGSSLFCALGFRREEPLDWSDSQWIEWRDSQIDHLLEPTFPFEGRKLLSNTEVVLRSLDPYELVARCLGKDPNFFDPTTSRGRAMANFVRFVTAQHWAALPGASHGMGLAVSDLSYVDQVRREVALPPLLTSETFLKDLDEPSGYKEAVSLIDRRNVNLPEGKKWIILPFESRFIKSPDQKTYGRLLVYVPGDVDLWVNFAIRTPDTPPGAKTDTVSVVAARPGASYTLDFVRRGGELVPMRELKPDPNDNCYDCHKASAMPIHPEREYRFGETGALISASTNIPAQLNARIRGYGPPHSSVQDATAYGPSLGQPDRKRTDESIRAASGTMLTPESIERVRNAMKCATCHDAFAPLNYPQPIWTSRDATALKSGRGLVQTFIEQGYMPPGNHLTAEERHALWLCLTKEYYDPATRSGQLYDWLRGR